MKIFTKTSIGQYTAYNRFVSANLKHVDSWDRYKINERQQILKKLMLNTWKVDTNWK